MKLGYHRDVSLSIEEAEARIRASLQAQGFGVLTEIDVKATLKQKLNVDVKPYKILGACHPQSAYQALSLVPEIGLLLPCNVTLSENENGTIRVAAIDAEIMLGIVKKPELAEVAREVNERLKKAVDVV